MKTSKTATTFITKRMLIDKANTTMLVAAAIAAFLVVFSLVSARALVGQLAYQNKVISEKKKTLRTIESNLEARDELVKSYNAFVSTPTNLIGGSSTASGDRNGNNSKIILDALPSKYDYPALASSLEKLVAAQNLTLNQLAGIDEEESQGAQEGSVTPKPAPIAFQVTVNGAYGQVQALINSFEKSIRPIKILSLGIASGDAGLKADISAETYYQSEKKFEITKKVVK